MPENQLPPAGAIGKVKGGKDDEGDPGVKEQDME
jgi:hypothetical protein